LENEKLITFHDVQFFEDETSSELVIVNINGLDIPPHWVNELVYNVLHKDNSILPVLILVDTINELTSKNKVYTISVLQVLNIKVTNQLPTVSKK